MNSAPRRVVITGIGVVCPLGCNKEALWEGLSSPRSAVGPLSFPVPGSVPVSFGAEATEFRGEIEDFGALDKERKKAIRKGLKVMCRECQMGVAAAQLALEDAGLAPAALDPERWGVSFGSDYMLSLPEEFIEGIRECLDDGRFRFSRWAARGMPKMSPLWLLKYLPNMPASHVAIYNDLRGPSNSVTMREASSNLAVSEAFQIIARGSADGMIAGATGTRIHPMKMMHCVQQEELAQDDGDPAAASRPFDLGRRGMVLGEGAGAVVLEELSRAEARGATIFGEVLAAATGSAIGRRLLADRRRAIAGVLGRVLAASGLGPEQIGHVHAHGQSTRRGDAAEAQAIHDVFGGRDRPVPVVAAKSHFGNLGAGSGAVELAASLLAWRHGRLFPVLNFRTPDPDCPISPVVDDSTEPGLSAVNVNVTPQGQASAVLVVRPS
jgi:3-oxoacyl-[acyl-carrier-protein] synthase II